jgi:protoheme IX farnesyltransferase
MTSDTGRRTIVPFAARLTHAAVHFELAKAPLTALVLVTTGIGYSLAGGEVSPPLPFLATMLGTALTAAGANALNQWWEAHRDARMWRTCGRPLPTGRVSTTYAFWWAVSAIVIGSAALVLWVNWLTTAMAVAAVLIYVLLYTPLKPRSSLCTLVGAVCGAIPPMMGWTAAAGRLEYGACVLGAVLFIWQVPHFMSLGWLYREDYVRGGFRTLPATDPSGQITAQVTVLYSLALLPIALAATAGGMAGMTYAAGSVTMGTGLVILAVRLYRRRTEANARRLFVSTIVYLPLLLCLMMADRSPVARVRRLAGVVRSATAPGQEAGPQAPSNRRTP